MTEYVFRLDPYAARCDATVLSVGERGVVLDRTVFYPTGGGQPGDRGVLVPADGAAVEIADALKGQDGLSVLHCLAAGATPPPAGARVSAEVDWKRRYRLMRMHSALHLLCAAVGCAVTGGQVGEQKGRLDFDVGGAQLDKDAIAARIGRWITDNRPIRERWIEADELAARPELVRTMAVKPPLTGGRVRLIESKALTSRRAAARTCARHGRSARSRSAGSRTRAARTGASTSRSPGGALPQRRAKRSRPSSST